MPQVIYKPHCCKGVCNWGFIMSDALTFVVNTVLCYYYVYYEIYCIIRYYCYRPHYGNGSSTYHQAVGRECVRAGAAGA